jgi:chromate reductase, NAD(P)H dehydrogenase (quinone)
MTTQRNIAVLVGSLRKDSFNRHIANALIKLAPDNLHFDRTIAAL